METTPQTTHTSKTSPKDFFLWLGAVIALYGSISFFIALCFEYINYAFPDKLAGSGDPYGSGVHFAMAGLIVLVPTLVVLFRLIRGTITAEPGKAQVWVRRWAIVLTLFIATVTILIDLITLLYTFFSGEVSTRFGLKVLIVLLVALGVFLHFLADQKGYWIQKPGKANLVGIAVGVLTLIAIVSGFLLIGTPTHVRMLRYDQQKVNDLASIQSQVVTYWQLKRSLPHDLSQTVDSLTTYTLPVDPQTGMEYRYEAISALSFKLCATFNEPTPDTEAKGAYATRPSIGSQTEDNWQHTKGEVCYTRTIDPELYPSALDAQAAKSIAH